MRKRWRTEYGGGEPTQVFPLNDERRHVLLGTECWCEPTVYWDDEETGLPFAFPIVVHHSADMRELIEEAEEIKKSATN